MMARKLTRRPEISITFLLLLSFTTFTTTSSQSLTYVGDDCDKSTEQALSSTYKNNLNSFLSWLSSTAAASKGYNHTSIGKGINETVYGLYNCRGDVTGYFCQFCVSTAAHDLLQRCPNRISAVTIFDFFSLRYSNLNFFGKVAITPTWNASRDKNISNPMELKSSENFMMSLIQKATKETNGLFAMGEFDLNHSEKRYGLVQCSRDITNEGCRQCLEAMLDKVSLCCGDEQGWQVVAPSCLIKYDAFMFYGSDNQSTSSAPNLPNSAKQGGTGKSRSRTLIISIISALVAVALLSFCMYYIWRRNASRNDELPSETTPISTHGHVQSEDSLNSDLPTIPLITVQQSTNHFSESLKLGAGGFGPVYKGVLPDGREIAVKRLSKTSGQGLEELRNEVAFIAKLQHRNLVRLLGCCIEQNEKLLVYEYMTNSSLDFHLFDETKRKQLDWKLRQNIINGIARGILYLHEDSRLKVIHRDLKASNVLLDHEMNPKISDFGLTRKFERGQNQANTKKVMGTYGYMTPEYAMERLFSVKSDVFNFGVLLLEIICGKRNSGFYLIDHGQSLLSYTWKLWCEGRCIELMDPILEKSHIASEVEKCIHIGLLCVQEDAADRPKMSTVVLMLASDTMALPKPSQPEEWSWEPYPHQKVLKILLSMK